MCEGIRGHWTEDIYGVNVLFEPRCGFIWFLGDAGEAVEAWFGPFKSFPQARQVARAWVTFGKLLSKYQEPDVVDLALAEAESNAGPAALARTMEGNNGTQSRP